MKKEKIFEKPIAIVIEFNNDDIILTSGEGDIGGINYPYWWGGTDGPDSPAGR